MKLVIPLNLADGQASTLLRLYEILIDSLVDFYSALQHEYPLADIQPYDGDLLDIANE